MKYLLTALFSSLLFISGVYAQPTYQTRVVNIPPSSFIRDMKFIDSLRGIAIDDEHIYSTIDAGENWTLKFTVPVGSNLSKINSKQDSIIVTGFYGFTGPSNLSFRFNQNAYTTVNLPNTHNLVYLTPILFNDSMWSTYGTGNPATDGLLIIKGGNYRKIDTSGCILDIYDDRISYYNQTHLKYSIDSAKSWTTVPNLPISSVVQSYFDGNSSLYVHKQGNFTNQYEDSAFVSHDRGLTWSRLSSKVIPTRLHFINSVKIVGNDSNNFYYSIDGGLSFSKIPYDLSTTFSSHLWVHSDGRYFVWTTGRGLIVIENSLLTELKEPAINKLNVQIVPNPTRGEFTITTDLDKIEQMHLYDMTGKLVERLNPRESVHHLEQHPEGLYFVSIHSRGAVETKKIILKK